MADTVGSGMIGGAINQQRVIRQTDDQLAETKRSNVVRQGLAKEELGERKRSNLVNEALTGEQVANQGRQVTVAESANARQEFDHNMAVREKADKISGFISTSLMDLYRQQETAIADYEEIKKQKKKLYQSQPNARDFGALALTGASEVALDKDPDVMKAQERVEALQKSFDSVQEGVGQYAKILPYSSNPDVTDLFRYEMSPYERMNTAPEDLTAYGKDQIKAIETMQQQQQAFNEELARSQAALMAEAEGGTAGAISDAVQENTLEQIDRKNEGRIDTGASAAQAKAIDDAAILASSDLGGTVTSIVEQVNTKLKLDEAGIKMPNPENTATAMKAFYGSSPAPAAMVEQDMLAINGFSQLMATPPENKVDFLQNTLPVVINYMTGGNVSEATEAKLQAAGIHRLSEMAGASNPLSNVMNSLAQITNKDIIKGHEKDVAGSLWITSQTRSQALMPTLQ